MVSGPSVSGCRRSGLWCVGGWRGLGWENGDAVVPENLRRLGPGVDAAGALDVHDGVVIVVPRVLPAVGVAAAGSRIVHRVVVAAAAHRSRRHGAAEAKGTTYQRAGGQEGATGGKAYEVHGVGAACVEAMTPNSCSNS